MGSMDKEGDGMDKEGDGMMQRQILKGIRALSKAITNRIVSNELEALQFLHEAYPLWSIVDCKRVCYLTSLFRRV